MWLRVAWNFLLVNDRNGAESRLSTFGTSGGCRNRQIPTLSTQALQKHRYLVREIGWHAEKWMQAEIFRHLRANALIADHYGCSSHQADTPP